jgi:hypothetical protein
MERHAVADTSERDPPGWTIGTVLLAIAALAVVILLYAWSWLDAWSRFPDVPGNERTGAFKAALERGVPARLEGGDMILLRTADVATVGPSTRDRDSTCASYSRRSCREVAVRFTCTYPVKLRSGRPATAILEIAANRDYELGVNASESRRPFSLQYNPDLKDAEEKFCRVGAGCRGERGSTR